jgi:uridine kinase
MPDSPKRARTLDRLAALVLSAERPHPIRVAIDGRGGAGKSTLADELAEVLRRRDRTVVRAEVDDFYQLELDRGTRSRLTAAAFYDAYDHAALRALLLDPLGPGGSRRYRTRWHDGWHPGVIDEPERTAPDDAILVLDGVFLLRPELVDAWDVRILVHVDPDVGLERGITRDMLHAQPDDPVADRERRLGVWRNRYLPADDAYIREVQPQRLADAVVDNNDLAAPRLRIRTGTARVSDHRSP